MKSVCVRGTISDSRYWKAKNEMIIEKIAGNIRDYPVEGRSIEMVALDRDSLSRPHQKVAAQSGEVFALSLPRGHVLEAGDVIYADEKRVVAIELEAEDALLIRPQGQLQWARAAYNLGNLHRSAFIQEDRIVTPYDAVLESVMQRLGVSYERANCPVDGVRANVSHREGHSHHPHGHAQGLHAGGSDE